MRDENLALIKRGYEAFGKGDLEFFREILTPDCVWRTPGYGLLLAEYKGVDGVIGYFKSLAEMTEGTFKSESEAFLADDEFVASLDHITGSRKGKVLDTHVVHVFRLRDLRVVEVTDYASEPKRNEEFWS